MAMKDKIEKAENSEMPQEYESKFRQEFPGYKGPVNLKS